MWKCFNLFLPTTKRTHPIRYMDYDCLVVGAGISGLFSAREILKKHPNWKVGLAERYKGVGGRTHTYTHGNNRWEAGAGRVHKNHKHTMDLIKFYGLN